MNTMEYQVTGMTCSHCETSVREEVGEIEGVDGIEVSADTGRLTVTAAANHFGVWPTVISRIERGLQRDDALADQYRSWLQAA